MLLRGAFGVSTAQLRHQDGRDRMGRGLSGRCAWAALHPRGHALNWRRLCILTPQVSPRPHATQHPLGSLGARSHMCVLCAPLSSLSPRHCAPLVDGASLVRWRSRHSHAGHRGASCKLTRSPLGRSELDQTRAGSSSSHFTHSSSRQAQLVFGPTIGTVILDINFYTR